MSKTKQFDLASLLSEPQLLNTKNYINGKWQKAVSQQTYEVINPASGASIAGVANSDAIDAANAARSALSSRRRSCLRRCQSRGRLCRRVGFTF